LQAREGVFRQFTSTAFFNRMPAEESPTLIWILSGSISKACLSESQYANDFAGNGISTVFC